MKLKMAFYQKFKNNVEFVNAGWLIGGRVVQMLLSLVVGILTARYLGPGDYGLVNYGLAYVNFFMALCTLGINSVIIKEFLDNPEEQGKAIGTTIVLRIISSLLSSVMIFGIVSIVDRNEPITIAVVVLCSTSLIFNSFDVVNYWFQSQYKSKIRAIISLVACIVMMAYRVVLLILNKSVVWFAFATSVEYIVISVLLLIEYKKHRGPRLSFSMVAGRRLLKNSYHFILASMMVAIYAQTDKFMLKQMVNEESVGFYSTATALCSMWVFVLAAIIDAVSPTIIRLYKSDYVQYEKKNRRLYAIVFYVSAIVSIGFVVFGKQIVGFLYGETFLPAVLPLKVITWYTAFSYLGVARNAWIVCEGKQKYLIFLYMGAAFINVILNCMLIPFLGATGAALASLITQVFVSIVIPLLIRDLRQNSFLMIQAICFRGIK